MKKDPVDAVASLARGANVLLLMSAGLSPADHKGIPDDPSPNGLTSWVEKASTVETPPSVCRVTNVRGTGNSASLFEAIGGCIDVTIVNSEQLIGV